MKLGVVAEFPVETFIGIKSLITWLPIDDIEIFHVTNTSYRSMQDMLSRFSLNIQQHYTVDSYVLMNALNKANCDFVHIATTRRFAVDATSRAVAHLSLRQITNLNNNNYITDAGSVILDTLREPLTNTEELAAVCNLKSHEPNQTFFRRRQLRLLLTWITDACNTTPIILPDSVIWVYCNRMFCISVDYTATTTATALHSYIKHKAVIHQTAGRLGAFALITSVPDCHTLTSVVHAFENSLFNKIWNSNIIATQAKQSISPVKQWVTEVVAKQSNVYTTTHPLTTNMITAAYKRYLCK